MLKEQLHYAQRAKFFIKEQDKCMKYEFKHIDTTSNFEDAIMKKLLERYDLVCNLKTPFYLYFQKEVMRSEYVYYVTDITVINEGIFLNKFFNLKDTGQGTWYISFNENNMILSKPLNLYDNWTNRALIISDTFPENLKILKTRIFERIFDENFKNKNEFGLGKPW